MSLYYTKHEAWDEQTDLDVRFKWPVQSVSGDDELGKMKIEV